MVLKKGRDGLGVDDFEVVEGSEDDDEQWAGARILKVMKAEAVIDAVVIVSRWYGGIMLGPIRFTHIEDCVREVCRVFRLKDEMEDCITTLTTLDETLARLRAELELLRGSSSSQTNIPSSVPATPTPTHPVQTSEEDVDEKPRKRRILESTQDYSELRKSADIKKAKRLVTARENSLKAVQNLIEKAKTL